MRGIFITVVWYSVSPPPVSLRLSRSQSLMLAVVTGTRALCQVTLLLGGGRGKEGYTTGGGLRPPPGSVVLDNVDVDSQGDGGGGRASKLP